MLFIEQTFIKSLVTVRHCVRYRDKMAIKVVPAIKELTVQETDECPRQVSQTYDVTKAVIQEYMGIHHGSMAFTSSSDIYPFSGSKTKALVLFFS